MARRRGILVAERRRNPGIVGSLIDLAFLGGLAFVAFNLFRNGGNPLGNGGLNIDWGNLINRATGAQISQYQLNAAQLQSYLDAGTSGQPTPSYAAPVSGLNQPGIAVPGTMHVENGKWAWGEWRNGELVTVYGSDNSGGLGI